MQNVAGYTFQEILDASHPEAEHWKGVGNKGVAEIFLVPHSWKPRLDALPKNWGAFCDFDVQPFGGKLAVIIPDFLRSDLYTLQRQIGAESSIVFSWHIASAIALLHDSGGAHGMLHAQSMGLDDEGRLSIRPGLLDPIQMDPDKKASAQATDCWQLAHVLEMLVGTEIKDERLDLLLGGLKQDRSKIRLQPARALRQSLVAITASNPGWEGRLKKALGDDWGMDVLPPIEHSIIPKLYPRRPRAQLPQNVDPQDYNPWSSPFVSTKSERLEAPKRISLPSGRKSEQKIRIPMPTQHQPLLEEDVDLLEQNTKKSAQIRLPFVSIASDAATIEIEQLQEDFVVSDEVFIEVLATDIPIEEDPFEESTFDVEAREEMPAPSEKMVEEDFVRVPASIEKGEAVSEDAESEESDVDDEIVSVSLKHTEEQVPRELRKDVESKPFASVDIEIQDDSEQTEEVVRTKTKSVVEVPKGTTQDPVLQLQNPMIRRENSVHENQPRTFLLKIPEPEDGFVDFIDEEALLSEDDTLDVSEERTVIAVETMIERREIEEVEEVLLPKTEAHKKSPNMVIPDVVIPDVVIPDVVIPDIVIPEAVVPEFFDDSEEPVDDSESFESEDEQASISVYEDSVADDFHHSQNLEERVEPDPLGSEEDFLASIFNDRDIKVLEAASANNLSAILPHADTYETKGEETEEYIPSASHSEGFSEQVAGFEESIEESVLEDSRSEEYSFSHEKIDVVQSLAVAFQVDTVEQERGHRNNKKQKSKSIEKDSPRWMAAKGINADPMREDELGSGKWGNAQSNLDQDILKEVMSTTPVRELDLDDDGNGWALMLVGLAGVVLFLLVLYGVISGL